MRHLRRVGHFEFGHDRRPINPAIRRSDGDPALWRDGEEVAGWARYWSQVYGFVADRLQANERLRQAALVVRYEDLCAAPDSVVRGVLEHCRLAATETVIRTFTARLSAPSYYKREFTDEELQTIHKETAATAARFGYADSSSGAAG